MIREAILQTFKDYPSARAEEFAGHPVAEWVRHKLPEAFHAEMAEFPDVAWVASPGQGRWADAPWVAGFDPLVTETAQEGWYPVYLFNRPMNAVYLSLNQGMARLREERGTQAKDTLAYRASILRARVSPSYTKHFSSDPIDLDAPGSQSRLAFYEPGHAFGKRYSRDNLPSQDELAHDLAEMLSLYREATIRGGTQELDTAGHAIAEPGDEYRAESSLEEVRRLRLHYRVERNQRLARLAKQAHGYTCEVCGFDFERAYGELGRQYIEAHHLTPLHLLPPDSPIRLSPSDDFAVVCANCHRMIHHPGAPTSFAEFKALFGSRARGR